MPDLRATRGLQATPAEPIPKLTAKVSQGRQRPDAAVGRSDRLSTWAGIAMNLGERPLWVRQRLPAMRERFYSDPRIGLSKSAALEIVTRNRAHFSRELRA